MLQGAVFKGKFYPRGFYFIRVRYLGENNVLLSGDSDETMKNTMEENKK